MSDPFEFQIKQLNKAVEGITEKLATLRSERGEIKAIPHMIKDVTFSVSGDLSYSTDFASYVSRYGIATVSTIERGLKAALDRLDAVEKRVEDYHCINIPAIENNQRVRQSMIDFMSSFGISKTKIRTVRIGRKERTEWIDADWISEIHKAVPTNDNYATFKSGLENTRNKFKREAAEKIKDISLKEMKQKQEEQSTRDYAEKLIKALQYCADRGIATAGMSNDDIIRFWEETIYISSYD